MNLKHSHYSNIHAIFYFGRELFFYLYKTVIYVHFYKN